MNLRLLYLATAALIFAMATSCAPYNGPCGQLGVTYPGCMTGGA